MHMSIEYLYFFDETDEQPVRSFTGLVVRPHAPSPVIQKSKLDGSREALRLLAETFDIFGESFSRRGVEGDETSNQLASFNVPGNQTWKQRTSPVPKPLSWNGYGTWQRDSVETGDNRVPL